MENDLAKIAPFLSKVVTAGPSWTMAMHASVWATTTVVLTVGIICLLRAGNEVLTVDLIQDGFWAILAGALFGAFVGLIHWIIVHYIPKVEKSYIERASMRYKEAMNALENSK